MQELVSPDFLVAAAHRQRKRGQEENGAPFRSLRRPRQLAGSHASKVPPNFVYFFFSFGLRSVN